MKRFAFAILLLFLATAAAPGAGVFNGSSSDLSATVTGTAPDYPILVTAWVKANASTDADTVVALSDNNAGGSLDTLRLAVEGTTVKAYATAAGSSSNASASGLTLGAWQFIAAYFESASSRKVKIGTGAWSSAETTTRSVGNYTLPSIGSHHSGASSNWFNGSIAEVGIWLDFDNSLLDLTVAQLAGGLQPDQVWHSTAKLYLHQPLSQAENERRVTLYGPALTKTSVNFAADLPFNINPVKHGGGRWFDWPVADSAPLPVRRLVTVGTDRTLALAADDSTAWIGRTQSIGSIYHQDQLIRLRGDGSDPWLIEKASGASFTAGSIAYAADDGTVDDTGTVEIGIVVKDHGTWAELIPY